MPAENEQPVKAGVLVGPFRLIRSIGRGSTSRVYLGERVEGFAQTVAIKILNATSWSEEENLLSSLDHPYIVRLLDQGTLVSGETFFALQYVDGLPLGQFCDRSRLSISHRLRLLRKVMSAVSYAHRHLVVHADLKPSNILVDADGEPKVLDFGIARALIQNSSSDRILFTPAYGSPEQRTGKSATVASDVYALGVLAHFLLVGIVPPGADVFSACPATASIKVMQETRLREFAELRSTSPNELRRAIAGDLDVMLATALQVDPNQRYKSVEAFSADILAYLEGRNVSVRAATRLQRITRWTGHHRIFAASAGVFTLAILFAALGIVVQTARAEYQRRLAQDRLHELVRLTATLDGELYTSVEQLASADKARQILLQGATDTLDQLAQQSGDDPSFSLELAAQYERLARLQIASATASARDANGQALMDVDKAIALLARLRNAGARSHAATQRLQELAVLRNSLKS